MMSSRSVTPYEVALFGSRGSTRLNVRAAVVPTLCRRPVLTKLDMPFGEGIRNLVTVRNSSFTKDAKDSPRFDSRLGF